MTLVLISALAGEEMLNKFAFGQTALGLKLHTGNPGGGGNENVAVENKFSNFTLPKVTATEVAAGRKNSTVAEWIEVKAAETYSFVSMWANGNVLFVGYVEMAAPITVALGDSFRFPVHSIVVTL